MGQGQGMRTRRLPGDVAVAEKIVEDRGLPWELRALWGIWDFVKKNYMVLRVCVLIL